MTNAYEIEEAEEVEEVEEAVEVQEKSPKDQCPPYTGQTDIGLHCRREGSRDQPE